MSFKAIIEGVIIALIAGFCERLVADKSFRHELLHKRNIFSLWRVGVYVIQIFFVGLLIFMVVTFLVAGPLWLIDWGAGLFDKEILSHRAPGEFLIDAIHLFYAAWGIKNPNVTQYLDLGLFLLFGWAGVRLLSGRNIDKSTATNGELHQSEQGLHPKNENAHRHYPIMEVLAFTVVSTFVTLGILDHLFAGFDAWYLEGPEWRTFIISAFVMGSNLYIFYKLATWLYKK